MEAKEAATSKSVGSSKAKKTMKYLIQGEEFSMFSVLVFVLFKLSMGISWVWYVVFFCMPDVGMICYLVNTKVGAFIYNLFHHKAVGGVFIIFGVIQTNNYLLSAGILFIAHTSFDRMIGVGLKYPDSFKHTSIGSM